MNKKEFEDYENNLILETCNSLKPDYCIDLAMFKIGDRVRYNNEEYIINDTPDLFSNSYHLKHDNPSLSFFLDESDLNKLIMVHEAPTYKSTFGPHCECGAKHTVNPLNHSHWCPLASIENDN